MGWREHRYAPSIGALLCPLSGVPNGGYKELIYGDGEDALHILLYRGPSGVRAYVNSYPHFSLPLKARPDGFLLLSEGQIMCASHCAIFRLEDGCVAGPAEGSGLEPRPVTIIDGAIYMDERHV